MEHGTDGVSTAAPTKGIAGYFIENLRARNSRPAKTLIGYVCAWTAWAMIFWVLDVSAFIPTYPAKAVSRNYSLGVHYLDYGGHPCWCLRSSDSHAFGPE